MLAKPLPFLKVPLAAVRLGILALLENCLNRQYYLLQPSPTTFYCTHIHIYYSLQPSPFTINYTHCYLLRIVNYPYSENE